MARRYSGEVTIYVQYKDGSFCPYKCRVVTPYGSRRLHIGDDAVLRSGLAVDSPAAYDSIAKAALSFAMDADEREEKDWVTECTDCSVSSYAQMYEDGTDWYIARHKCARFPAEEV